METEKDAGKVGGSGKLQQISVADSHTTKVINLAPYKVTDSTQIAELWEKLVCCIYRSGTIRPEIYRKGNPFSDSSDYDILEFHGTTYRSAMRALDNPKFKNLISVEAMVFPVIYCSDKVEKHYRYYKELSLSEDKKIDLLPVSNVRDKRYCDPWTDGMFPTDLRPNGTTSATRILPETCISVKCPHCQGRGEKARSYAVEHYKRITCPNCEGSGKTGAVLCKRCKGTGKCNEEVTEYADKFVECKECGGSGKIRSVLQAVEKYGGSSEDVSIIPGVNSIIPKCVIKQAIWRSERYNDTRKQEADVLYEENGREAIGAYGWKTVVRVSENGRRVILNDDMIPDFGCDTEKVKKLLTEIHEQLDDNRAHYLSEEVHIGYLPRFVRFHLKIFFYVQDYGNHKEIMETGHIPEGHFKLYRQNESSDMIVWLDLITRTAFVRFIENDDHDIQGFDELLFVMGRSIEGSRGPLRRVKKNYGGKAKESKNGKIGLKFIWGILWRLVFATGAGFLFWWWFEGFNKEALPGMLEQVKGIRSGIAKNLSLAMMVSGGSFVALYLLTFLLSKVSISFRGVVQVVSSIMGGLSATALILSGHWCVGGWMAIALICAISYKFENKVHESAWRWILMGIAFLVSGGFGMNDNWIISSVLTFVAFGLVVETDDD